MNDEFQRKVELAMQAAVMILNALFPLLIFYMPTRIEEFGAMQAFIESALAAVALVVMNWGTQRFVGVRTQERLVRAGLIKEFFVR